MAALQDRVVIVTGAGRGLGREHALLASSEGAKVVVNDLGCGPDGTGADPAVAGSVVEEIIAAGGQAVASTDDAASMKGAQALFQLALDHFGEVHGLVNNAGILRDRMFVNMPVEDWDAVIRGQLRATFCPTKVAVEHWRAQAKAGAVVSASIVNVPSTSGLIGQVGQTNYGAAKAGIASLSVILAEEVGRYGVRVNGVVPVARTRMTQDLPGVGQIVAIPTDPGAFDTYHPGNVSPLVAWLLKADNTLTGRVFYAKGGEIRQFLGWQYGTSIDKGDRWLVEELDDCMTELV